MNGETPFNPNSLRDWINVLHNAAAVPKGHADYAEARQMVALASNRIRMLNRQASEREVETPSALETAAMSTVANVAGDVASTGVSALETLPEVGPLLKGTGFTSWLDGLMRQLAGRVALDVTDTDAAAYERGQEAHPLATAAGEMAGPTLLALMGVSGRRALERGIMERFKPLPPSTRGLPNIEMELTPAGVPGLKPVNQPVAPYRDPLDVPTYQRRRAVPEVESTENPASVEILRRILLGRPLRKRGS